MNLVKDRALVSVSRKTWTTPTVRQIGVIARIEIPREASADPSVNDPAFAVRRHRVDVPRRDAAAHS